MLNKSEQILNKEESKNCKEYYKKHFPALSEEECIKRAKEFNKSKNYRCIEYYKIKYPNLSIEECENLRIKRLEEQKKKRTTNILYWKEKYPEKSNEELEELRSKAAKEKNKCNLEYWIKKYPEKDIEELKKLHDEHYQSWLSHQEGWGNGDKNNNSKKNTTQKERNAKSPRNIEFYIKKYPELSIEECEKLRQDFFKKNNERVKSAIKDTNIEYYLNQGLSKEEAYLRLKERQTTFTLEKCIQKYGEEIGTIKYYERQKKWLKKLYENFKLFGDGRSIQSKFAYECIKEICKYFKIEIPKKEKFLYNKINKKAYAYDFCYNHKIIEFNGDYWHCNPNLYDKTFYNKVKQKTAKEIWEYDEVKANTAKNYNYKILTIWESEYNNDKEKTIKKCIDFIKS
jgi:hypothetical protein